MPNCYKHSIELAETYELREIAFPNISTGIFKFPKQLAAEIVLDFLREYESEVIDKVILICYDSENYSIYESLIK